MAAVSAAVVAAVWPTTMNQEGIIDIAAAVVDSFSLLLAAVIHYDRLLFATIAVEIRCYLLLLLVSLLS